MENRADAVTCTSIDSGTTCGGLSLCFCGGVDTPCQVLRACASTTWEEVCPTTTCAGAFCNPVSNGSGWNECTGLGDGSAYRCANHPSAGGNLEQWAPRCQNCIGCCDNQTSSNPCPSGQTCYYPSGPSSNATCATLAGVTSFTAIHYQGNNLITWATGSERLNLGFNVYKVRRDGTVIRRVNHEFILGSMKTPVGEVYRVADPGGGPGDRYILEWRDHDGPVHRKGPAEAVSGAPSKVAKRFDAARIRGLAMDKRRRLRSMNGTYISTTGTIVSPLTSGDCSGLRIKVGDAGPCLVNIADLEGTGLDLSGLDTDEISLTLDGAPVPFRTSAHGTLGVDDTIEFYGQQRHSLHSASNTYMLDVSKEASAAMAETSAAPVDGQEYVQSYTAVTRFEEDALYALTPAIDDFFYWAYVYPEHPEEVFTVHIDAIAAGNDTFRFTADLDGITNNPEIDPDHHHQVLLNGNMVKDFQWEGTGLVQVDEELPIEWLNEGKNTVTVKYVGDTGSEYDMVAVDGFTFVYERRFATDDNELLFTYDGPDVNVAVDGFSINDVDVYDVTDADQPVLLTGADVQDADGVYTVSFSCRDAAAGTRSYHLVATGEKNVPTAIEARYPTDIRSSDKGADLLVIAFDAFTEAMAPLVQMRRDKGFRVEVVTTSEIYDEFNHGNISDDALKDFLVYAAANWKPPAPSNVLLVGDSTNDPGDRLGLGLVNYVPSHFVETELWGGASSDNWYVDLDDNGEFDIAIGRMSVTTPEEAELAVQKVLAYEEAQQPTDGWSNRVILVADQDDEGAETPFEQVLAAIEGEIPSGYDSVVIRVGDFESVAEARARLLDELGKGSLLVVYVGHGSGLSWGADPVFEAKDIESLPEGVHQPLAISLSCVNGYFTYPGLDILGEAFVKPSTRGAIASWMPGDIGFPSRHEVLIKAFARHLFGEQGTTVGDAVKAALNELAGSTGPYDRSIAETFVYMGDPTMELHTISSGLTETPGSSGCSNSSDGMVGLVPLFGLALGLIAAVVLRRRRVAG